MRREPANGSILSIDRGVVTPIYAVVMVMAVSDFWPTIRVLDTLLLDPLTTANATVIRYAAIVEPAI